MRLTLGHVRSGRRDALGANVQFPDGPLPSNETTGAGQLALPFSAGSVAGSAAGSGRHPVGDIGCAARPSGLDRRAIPEVRGLDSLRGASRLAPVGPAP